MSNFKVLIAGASIAGPTAAYWFAKAGFNVTIIERFPSLRTSGQNIDIRTAGVTVMRKIAGMEAAVRSKTTEMDGISIVRQDGQPIATMRATGDPNAQSLVSEFEIFRGDLAQILYDLTKNSENVRYVFGEQVAAMHHYRGMDGPITVEFANGYPTAEYDLVVACDGATSRTRALGLGCGVRDHIISLNSWSAYFSVKQDLLNGSKTGQGYSAVGGRFLAVGPDPSGSPRVILQSVHPRNDTQDVTRPFRKAVKDGDEALKKFVAQRFRDAGWKADEIIKGMMEADDFYASELVQVKVPSLSKGRFVLVGDAGYAAGPTGTGTSLALAGAYVLAGEISTHSGDIAAGLRAYEERMKPLIEDFQKIPMGVPAVMAPQTAWGIWLRNVGFLFVCWIMKFGSLFAWLGGFWASSFGGDKYALPDYGWGH